MRTRFSMLTLCAGLLALTACQTPVGSQVEATVRLQDVQAVEGVYRPSLVDSDVIVDSDPVAAREASFTTTVRPLESFPWPDLVIDESPVFARGFEVEASAQSPFPWADLIVDPDPANR